MSLSTRAFRIGLDFGQKIDHSAVCLVEEKGNLAIVKLLLKYKLGTPYPLIVNSISQILYPSVIAQGEILSFASDATGVGTVPTQMLQQRIPDARIEAFVFNNQRKRELVGKVKVLHSFGRLKIAKKMGDEFYNRTVDELIQEMRQLQAKVIREDPKNPEIEVFRTGEHDDLFTALALACKDIEIREQWSDAMFVIEDRSWARTPLDSPAQMPVFFDSNYA